MDSVSSLVANGFSSFIAELSRYTTDWQIGVVTNDNGCFNNGILDEATSGYESLFTSAVQSGGCNSGYPSCKSESLLEISSIALAQTTGVGCNDGFLRTDAFLHIIVVSDEHEQSGTGWSNWLWDYTSYVSDPALLMVSGIVDYNMNCGDSTGASGYVEAIDYTGGELLDVCSTLSPADIATLAAPGPMQGSDIYALSAAPDTTSLEVYVDGVQWATDWHYDSSRQSIIFDVDLVGGEDIEVFYTVDTANCP
jgi:hypothetical protein